MPGTVTPPHLYLDTNVILDAIHERYEPSVRFMDRARREADAKRWRCSTSRFTILEMLDIEQEERFVELRHAEGHPLSQVRGMVPSRRQPKWSLPQAELDAIYFRLHKALSKGFAFINYEHPVIAGMWDLAEDYCAATSIGAHDAVHLAFAIAMRCNIIVSRDSDFRVITNNDAHNYLIATSPDDIDDALQRLQSST